MDEYRKTTVKLNDVKVQMDIDSGASTNIVDEGRFCKIQERSKEKLQLGKFNVKLCGYGSEADMCGCEETKQNHVAGEKRISYCRRYSSRVKWWSKVCQTWPESWLSPVGIGCGVHTPDHILYTVVGAKARISQH